MRQFHAADPHTTSIFSTRNSIHPKIAPIPKAGEQAVFVDPFPLALHALCLDQRFVQHVDVRFAINGMAAAPGRDIASGCDRQMPAWLRSMHVSRQCEPEEAPNGFRRNVVFAISLADS
ncbi:hypothetical protein [Bradyrhizobium sp. 195]|uniref:hypothetical protein n=1 Tax=Bradyrhizobium sp. 195 TaxID=2782662 RepID=UPI002000A8A9|nr:hypothetical protein [Bradyrhizobium sp. 195]UPK28260.1 hypothetical protein IVB26_07320 [Bradyrhizobium sp. 195]